MTNKDLAHKIIELVGSEKNVASAAHCMTRVRLKVKDASKVDFEGLKNVDGILGVVESDTLQVVVGPGKAKKVYDAIAEDFTIEAKGDAESGRDWEENKQALKAGQKESALKQGLKTIANIFIPLIPAIIAAGLFNGFASLIGQTIKPTAGFWFLTQQLFSLLGGGFLGYFAVYTGINAAKEFGGTPAMGGVIGGVTIGAGINTISTALGLFNAETP